MICTPKARFELQSLSPAITPHPVMSISILYRSKETSTNMVDTTGRSIDDIPLKP